MKAIEKNLIEGPDIIPAGHIIATTGSPCDQSRADPTITQPGPEDGIGDDVDSLVKAVRTQIKYGAKVIKVCADHNAFSEQELKAIADAAHQRKIKFAAHVWDEESIRKSIAAGADSIEHCGIMSDATVDEMVKKGIYLVPTMHTLDDWDLSELKPEIKAQIEKEIPEFEESFRRSLRKGMKMAFGSDSGQIPHGENAKEFTALVKRGMPPLQAIQSATLNAADLLSMHDRGEIKEGLRADLVAVAGNPLERISALEKTLFVMKAGKIYKQP
jgi:imidazolonepropionase-like amidohydrolase